MELKLITRDTICKTDTLLIVPYGIETLLVYTVSTQSWSFNRTLWN